MKNTLECYFYMSTVNKRMWNSFSDANLLSSFLSNVKRTDFKELECFLIAFWFLHFKRKKNSIAKDILLVAVTWNKLETQLKDFM